MRHCDYSAGQGPTPANARRGLCIAKTLPATAMGLKPVHTKFQTGRFEQPISPCHPPPPADHRPRHGHKRGAGCPTKNATQLPHIYTYWHQNGPVLLCKKYESCKKGPALQLDPLLSQHAAARPCAVFGGCAPRLHRNPASKRKAQTEASQAFPIQC